MEVLLVRTVFGCLIGAVLGRFARVVLDLLFSSACRRAKVKFIND